MVEREREKNMKKMRGGKKYDEQEREKEESGKRAEGKKMRMKRFSSCLSFGAFSERKKWRENREKERGRKRSDENE